MRREVRTARETDRKRTRTLPGINDAGGALGGQREIVYIQADCVRGLRGEAHAKTCGM